SPTWVPPNGASAGGRTNNPMAHLRCTRLPDRRWLDLPRSIFRLGCVLGHCLRPVHTARLPFLPTPGGSGRNRSHQINPNVNYGPLNGIARDRIKTDLIARKWDDLLRVAGSLKLGPVSVHERMRIFQGGGRNPGFVHP